MKKTYMTSFCSECKWISLGIEESRSIIECEFCGNENHELMLSFSDQIGYSFEEFQSLFLKFNVPLSYEQKQFYEEHRRNFEIEFLL